MRRSRLFIIIICLFVFVSGGFELPASMQAAQSGTTMKLPKMKTASSGFSHMLAVGKDGSLWAWGENSRGQLGDGTYVSQPAPIQIGSGKDWVDAAAGYYSSMGIRKDGSLWLWGADQSGGVYSASSRQQLTPLRYGNDKDWVKVAAGDAGGVALKKDGTIIVFGLGVANGNSKYGSKLNNDKDWADVSVGDGCLLAIKKNGSLWAIGTCVRSGESTNGRLTRIGEANDWKQAAAGYYAVAVKKDGSVYELWENRETGEIEEQLLLEMNKAVYVSGGFVATIVTDDGGVWEWDTMLDRYYQIDAGGVEIIAADGGNTGVAISRDGALYTYGSNTWGQRGNGQSDSIYRPSLSTDTFQSQVTVDFTTYTLHDEGTIGMVDWYMEEEQLFPDSDWAFIAAGRDDLYAIKHDGSLWKYETSIYMGNYTYRPNEDHTLHPFLEGSTWRTIQASELGYVVGLKTDGSLWIWGRDAWGYVLKDYTDLENYYEPTQIGIDKDWKSFSVSDDHILAIKEDGSLWGMGDNRHIQVASTLKPQIDTFARIGSMKDWTQVQTSPYTTIGLRKDGTLWQWGQGFGSPNSNQKMTQLTKDKDWIQIWAKDNQAFGLKKDGSLWSWGDNYFGELGIGSARSQSVPTRIADNGPWATIYPQDYYTIGVKKDGSIWKWGNASDSWSQAPSKDSLEMTPVVTEVVVPRKGFAAVK